MSALSEQFAGRSRRERLVLALGALVTVLLIVYATVWQPWQAELNRLRAQVPREQRTLAWMRRQAAQVKSYRARSETAATQTGLPLLTLVERSANKAGIREAITRMSAGDNENQIRVWIDNADFDLWIRWLAALKANGVEVAEAEVSQAEGNRVNIRTTLLR